MGLIQPRDIWQAEAYAKVLPGHLKIAFGLAPEQILVEPGAGFTFVNIARVKSESERQRIAMDLARINSENPKLYPLKWTFDDHRLPRFPMRPKSDTNR